MAQGSLHRKYYRIIFVPLYLKLRWDRSSSLFSMAPQADARRTVGAQVQTKAKNVTSFPECRRLYGSLASSASELIDNTYNHEEPSQSLVNTSYQQQHPQNIALGPQLISTRKRKPTGFAAQRGCIVCKKRSTLVCSACRNASGNEVFFCSLKGNSTCFESHVLAKHGSNSE